MRGRAWRGGKPYKTPVSYCPLSGKVMFDKKGAQTAANERLRKDHEELRIYPCPTCNHWHLTSTALWRNRKYT